MVEAGNWNQNQWREFVLEQFLRESDDNIEYTLEDAKEIYQQ